MVALTKQLYQGERLSLMVCVTSNNCISTSDEYEPLVNEDETPSSTV